MVHVTKPNREPLSKWIEANVCLPQGLTAEPGPIKLAPYMRQIADAIGDPKIERVSILKSARIGFTTCMTGAVARYIVDDPCQVLVLLPTESDARDYAVTDFENTLLDSRSIAPHLPMPAPGRSTRVTILHRPFKNGSVKFVAGQSPRNLRRHTAKVLFVDEADALQSKTEGDAISLAEKRTLGFPDRKIVVGSTPLDEGSSVIARLYAASDQRVWEVPCPSCRAFSEIKWNAIEYPPGEPERAAWRCPSCHTLVEERHKAKMVSRGRWRALRPEAGTGHAGFRINALASLLPNATWAKLAAEYEGAKDNPDLLRVFRNTVLGEPWRDEMDTVDDLGLAARAEDFDLRHLPAECRFLTCGIDCADDRLEAVIVGWALDGTAFMLDHQVIYGSIDDELLWQQVDDLLRMRWPHPAGGSIGISAAGVDGGDGAHLPHVLAFCRPRASRRILTVKGAAGFSRAPLTASKSKMKGGGRLFVVGSDAVKTQIFARLQRPGSIRFSKSLSPIFYEQLLSERPVVRWVGGRPVRRFERISRGAKAEVLDAVVYAFAVKATLDMSPAAFSVREAELTGRPHPAPVPQVIRSQWMERGRDRSVW